MKAIKNIACIIGAGLGVVVLFILGALMTVAPVVIAVVVGVWVLRAMGVL